MAHIKQFAKDLLSTEKLLRYSSGHRFIFSYHDIGIPGTDHHSPRNATPPRLFEEQLDVIRRHFRIVPLDEITDQKDLGKGNFAAITFDDGFHSVYTRARPILKAANIPYAVFINGAAVTTGENWISNMECYAGDEAYNRSVMASAGIADNKVADPVDAIVERGKFHATWGSSYQRPWKDAPLYMSREQLTQLHSEGVILGDHTWDHVVLSGCSNDVLKDQLTRGIDLLRSITGSHSIHHAIPFGKRQHYHARSVKLLRSLGLTRIYNTNPYRFTAKNARDPHFIFPRIGVIEQTAKELLFCINRTLLRRYDL